jgi:uncharacterized protein (DUF2236 family)
MRGDDVRRGADVRSIADMAGESLLLGGGGRAILLQLAHPAVGHGVAEHSDFVDRPLARLHGTMTYLYAIVFGTPDEVVFVRGLVDRAHRRVRSTASSPVAYDAVDPQLQLWVAATLYDSAISLYERVHGELSAEAAEDVYREYVVVGSALQMPAELWPADRAAFRTWWDEQVEALVVDDVTRDVARQLLHPVNVPIALRAAMPLARLVTAGLLPDRVREAFGLPWGRWREWLFDAVIVVSRAVVPRLPGRVRHVLRDQYLRRLRRYMARQRA